jgi:hypothetical protein
VMRAGERLPNRLPQARFRRIRLDFGHGRDNTKDTSVESARQATYGL